MRMIQFSSEKVSGNTKEALLLVLFLLIFAVVARSALQTSQHALACFRFCRTIIACSDPQESYVWVSVYVCERVATRCLPFSHNGLRVSLPPLPSFFFCVSAHTC